MNVLYIYKWCTFGGVERVLLNRAFAYKEFGLNVKSDIFFVYPGVQAKLQEYIYNHNIQDFISVKTNLEKLDYDVIISIDTEEAFDIVKDRKIILEIHTTYKNHISYLQKIDLGRIEMVLMPSKYTLDDLEIFKGIKVNFLPNFVIDRGFDDKEKYIFPKWQLTPICYLGRIDKHKNPHFILQAINQYKDILYNKILFCNIGFNLDPEFLNMVSEYGLQNRVLLFPNITFDRVKPLIQFLKQQRGVFVSASYAESFGMSIAEAIYFGLPVLVSNIPSHRELVENDSRFLFDLDNYKEFVEKLVYIIDNYQQLKDLVPKFSKKLDAKNFIDSWVKIFGA